ncbi:MOSC domain-containing protein [Okeania sp. KiyG1]|uniref:MOSC domain-containing protein n=1 Tax=Okeania sp. KiyG1 TaxID=2720165 RepID=UPI001922E86B|nr:MOSC domain-containing protein [Okeania sp. KiyG1]GGA17544.1 molybdenum cofactor sulfurase [Okeania sp. KiyG1]
MKLATVKQLFIHPVKGLTPQICQDFFLTSGYGIKGDRSFALMFLDSDNQTVGPEVIPWMSKKHFAVQNDWPGLAALNCEFDSETGFLTVRRQGVELLKANTGLSEERDRISTFFTDYLKSLTPNKGARHPQKAPVQLVGNGSTTRYPDREIVHISIISQATMDDLGEKAGKILDIQRFRPNVVVDGMDAWSEFDLVGKQLRLGNAQITVTAKIGRCMNIEVDPETGDRDIPLLSVLKEKFGHAHTGVLATVDSDGGVAVGDVLQILSD